MALGDITNEIKRHYVWIRLLQADIPTSQPRLPEVIADALRDQLAARRKAEFFLEHREPEEYNYRCERCQYPDPKADRDPRHNWTDADWRAAAETEFSVGA